MKAIHNPVIGFANFYKVVLYPKDTEKWKQFTTKIIKIISLKKLFCIPKILKNESNSQRLIELLKYRYVVLYPKDTEKWKQFTTLMIIYSLKMGCFVSQRYWKMKAIHNNKSNKYFVYYVVLYPKDTEKWKQFTTHLNSSIFKI